MSTDYKLVFRGELAADQHLAVVRKRLGKLLKANDKTLDALFSGQPVVLRKSIDAAGAAKFQAAFKQAGARLRVQPNFAGAEADAADAPAAPSATAAEPKAAAEPLTDAAPASAMPATPATATTAPRTTAPTAAVADSETAAGDGQGWHLLPVGSLMLEVEERVPAVRAAVDVTHLTLAEVGARIGPVIETMADTERFLRQVEAFELAEPGATLGAGGRPDAVTPAIAPDYALAEPGALLVQGKAAAAVPAPDVAHLELVPEPDQD